MPHASRAEGAPQHYPHRVQLLSGRFRYAERRGLFGQARLFGDRIELVEWRLSGRDRRTLPLDRIAYIDYHVLENGSNFSLYMDDGEAVHLHLQDAHRWREYFAQWLQYSVLASAKLVGGEDEATALSG